MEDGQQHQAIVAPGDVSGDGGWIAEMPTAERVAVPSAPDAAEPVAAPAPSLPPQMATRRPPANASPRTPVARPFTPGVAALIAVCCFALVGVSYSVAVLAGADWTRGAQIGAYVAFALALLALAGGALRAYAARRVHAMQQASTGRPYAAATPSPRRERGLGGEVRRPLVTLGLALLLAATLAGTGATGLLIAPGLHRTQARVLEQSGRYAAAVAEYALAGDTAPNAPDIARTYDEWAASLLHQKQYAAALSRYLLVAATYPGAATPYAQAEAGIFATYTAWIAVNGSGVPYPDAIAYIQSYAQSAACDTTCQGTVTAILPQAAYQFGTQLSAAGQYAAAVKQLATVKAQYPHSPYAAQAHAAAAVAYLGLGKQQLPTDCGAAVKTYQTLARQYADTPQGTQAKQALAVPQPVSGTISKMPPNAAPTIYLSRSADTVSYYFSDDFHTSVNTQSGAFSFASVPVGTYYLSAVRTTADGTQTTWWNAPDGSIYTVQVSPLCGAQLGSFPFE